ncbi:hypothetical protein HZB93_04515 [Candidatus Falkowbacteria bacterium]|nr:hypothetical protein [Candidatus Falkowbacteria bacterium]
MMTRKNNSRHFIFALPVFLILIFSFFSKSSLAVTTKCEYIPKDSSQRILYFEGTDANHRPWTREMDDAECNAKCSSESPTGLKFQCAVSGSVLGGLIPQNPEGCDATYTTCGEVSSPTLTIKCKFTPKRSDGTTLDGAWETLTTSESECQSLCDGAAGRGLCSSWCGTIGSALCCDETQTTCEKTNNAPPAPETYQFESVTPTLETPLPTFSGFMDVVLQGEAPNRYILIPWLGQYIAAIYKYAIGIVGILSGIMIIVGGLLWLTAGGAADRVSTAKSFIESSLVGLVIALTSFLLLYAINPKLTEFDSLKVKYVERVDPFIAGLSTTTTDTRDLAGDGGSTEPTPSFTECPISLPESSDENWTTNPRTKEFLDKIGTVVTGSTPREKVIQIAEAAAKCGVTLGSCGKTSENINNLAGVGGGMSRGRSIHEISVTQRKYLCTLNCGARVDVSHPCDPVHKEGREDIPCLQDARNLPASSKKTDVYNKLKSEISNWPDSWADDLEPGDSFVVFNGNSDPPGNHTAIFMGWASEGRAKVIQGAYGRLVNENTICIKSNCPTPSPLVIIFKPQ